MRHFTQWCEAEWPGLLEWMESGRRCLATGFMVDAIVGIPASDGLVWWPRGQADLDRCLELLRAVPSMVPHLGQLVRRNIAWHPWVERMRKELVTP